MQITVLSDRLTIIKELRYKLGIELSNCIKIYDKLVNNQFDDIVEVDRNTLINFLSESDCFIIEQSEPFAVETECGLLLEIDYEADTVASEYWCICSEDCRGRYFISDINKKEKMISLELARNLYPKNLNRLIATLEVLNNTYFKYKDTEKTFSEVALRILSNLRESINRGYTNDVIYFYNQLVNYTVAITGNKKTSMIASILEFIQKD